MAAITLAEAKNNTSADLDLAVIDEFRKESVILDSLVFDASVNPTGGGDTLTYGYRRQITQPTAATRAINSEYADQNVTTQKYTTDLAVMGGSFSVDRVSAALGAAGSGAIALNMSQKIKAARTKFQDLVINGDTAVDANGFDGLDKALIGSTTEYNAAVVSNWSDLDTDQSVKFKALDALDEFLSFLDGTPTLILGNKSALAKVRAIVRRTGMYTRDPIEGLVGQDGRPITRESYGGIVFADPGDIAGASTPIIPVATRTVATVSTTFLTDIYAIRIGMDGFHGVSAEGGTIVKAFLPKFEEAGAVKRGEVELGPVSVALRATKAAAVFRNIKIK
ncbi:MAG: RoPhREQ3 [Rhodoglobus sp.]|nr:RoPhREQ3 [Rhodoglobus sp.]